MKPRERIEDTLPVEVDWYGWEWLGVYRFRIWTRSRSGFRTFWGVQVGRVCFP